MTLVLTEDHGPRPPRRPEPPREAQRVQRRAGGGDRRGAARGGRRPARAVRRARGAGRCSPPAWTSARSPRSAEAPEHLRAFRADCLDAFGIAEAMPKPVVCQIHGALHRRRAGAGARVRPARRRRGRGDRPAGDADRPDPGRRRCVAAAAGRRPRPRQGADHDRQADRRDGGRAHRPRQPRRPGGRARERRPQTLVDELLVCAPVAVGLAKRAIDASARPALSTTLELEVALQEVCAATEDFGEGTAAFREKRPPVFRGGGPIPTQPQCAGPTHAPRARARAPAPTPKRVAQRRRRSRARAPSARRWSRRRGSRARACAWSRCRRGRRRGPRWKPARSISHAAEVLTRPSGSGHAGGGAPAAPPASVGERVGAEDRVGEERAGADRVRVGRVDHHPLAAPQREHGLAHVGQRRAPPTGTPSARASSA